MSTTHQEAPERAPESGPWAPLRRRVFLLLWLAGLASNIGTWMNEMAAGWLMTTLTDSTTLIALVRALVTLPVFMFAIPAGAFGDIFDRRKILLVVGALLTMIAGFLGLLVQLELITPAWLLICIFLLGTGTAFLLPLWQAIIPSLVPRRELAAAIALNSVAFNTSRAFGPALAGIAIVSLGMAYPFYFNALSYFAVIGAVYFWRDGSLSKGARAPAEGPLTAIVAGLRFVRQSEPMKATIKRAAVFFFFVSSYWALLPLVARDILQGGPQTYGYLTAAIGLGALVSALALPVLRRRFRIDHVATGGAFLNAAAMTVFGMSDQIALSFAASFVAGLGWVSVLNSLHMSAQTALPDWIRARGLSIYIVMIFGAMSMGSVIWGAAADYWDVPTALVASALLLGVATLFTMHLKLHTGDRLDLAPSMHWNAPDVSGDVDQSDGPVMVTVRYRVDAEHEGAFVDALHQLKPSRMKSGAYRWEFYRDSEDPEAFIESFWLNTWADHLRQHERVSVGDQQLQERIQSLLIDGEAPEVRHWIRKE